MRGGRRGRRVPGDDEAKYRAAWDYYTVWSFALFAVVAGGAWARLALETGIRAAGLRWQTSTTAWVPPASLLVGTLANTMLVGVGGQLLVAYGPRAGFSSDRMVPTWKCRRAATSHTEMHVLPMWGAALSIAALPTLLRGEDFVPVVAAAVPAALWATWFLAPASDGLRCLPKTRAVYGELPLVWVAVGAPAILALVIGACVLRARSCSDAVRGAVGCRASAAG